MRIQHNIMAMSAYRNYTNNVSAMKKNLEKLSSGYKINRAGDDAAGLAISEKMRAQITGLETAQKNAKDGISLVQTAEGAMTEVHDMLNRMVELATQSANGTYDNTTDRAQLQKEMDQLRSEINRIADSSNFNGIKLLDGSMSAKGVAGRDSQFDLPSVGSELGVDTVLNQDAASKTSGTSFSVDLHNRQIRNGAGDRFEIDTGDIKIVLTGTASGSAVAPVDASAIIGAIAGGASAASAAGFTVEIFLNGAATAVSASAIALASGGNGIVFKLGDKGDIKISAGTSGGDHRLTFTQTKRPTKPEGVWSPANSVKIRFTAGSNTTQTLSADNLIMPFVDNQGVAALGSKVNLTAGSLAASGTDKTALASATTGVANLTADVTVTGTKALAANKAGSIAIAVASLGNGSKTLVLKVGSTVIAKANTAIATIATGGSLVFDFGAYGKVTLKAGASAVTKSDIEGISGDKKLGGTINGTPAKTATIASTSLTDLGGAFNALGAGAGSIVLKATGTSGNPAYTLNVGSKSINVIVTASGAVKGTGASAATYFKLTGATAGEIFTAANGASGLKVGTFSFADTSGKPEIPASATLADVISILDGAASGSTAYFKDVTVATSVVATLTASVGSAITSIGSLPNIGSVIGSTIASALNGKTIAVGSLTVTFDANSFASTDTGSAALQKIVAKLNAAAATQAKADLAALGTAGGSITVYHNFRFENAAGSIVAQAAAGKLTLKYDTKTYSTQKAPDQSSGDPGFPNWDHNVSTTAIDRVGLDGGDRLASTHFTLTQEQVKDGARVQIGEKTYQFSIGSKGNELASGAVKVDISDLVDESGKLKDADAMTRAMERLTDAAKDNGTYSVGYDGKRITVTEIEGQGNYDLTTMDGIAKSLGYTSPDVAGNGGLRLQIGDTADSYNQLIVDIGDIHTNSLGIADISIETQDGAAAAVDAIKKAINTVSDIRGTLGATQNRLDHTINNLSVMTENIQDAESTIRDVDVAEEMMAYTKNNILIQSAQAMLAQANQVPQGVLQLLQ